MSVGEEIARLDQRRGWKRDIYGNVDSVVKQTAGGGMVANYAPTQ